MIVANRIRRLLSSRFLKAFLFILPFAILLFFQSTTMSGQEFRLDDEVGYTYGGLANVSWKQLPVTSAFPGWMIVAKCISLPLELLFPNLNLLALTSAVGRYLFLPLVLLLAFWRLMKVSLGSLSASLFNLIFSLCLPYWILQSSVNSSHLLLACFSTLAIGFLVKYFRTTGERGRLFQLVGFSVACVLASFSRVGEGIAIFGGLSALLILFSFLNGRALIKTVLILFVSFSGLFYGYTFLANGMAGQVSFSTGMEARSFLAFQQGYGIVYPTEIKGNPWSESGPAMEKKFPMSDISANERTISRFALRYPKAMRDRWLTNVFKHLPGLLFFTWFLYSKKLMILMLFPLGLALGSFVLLNSRVQRANIRNLFFCILCAGCILLPPTLTFLRDAYALQAFPLLLAAYFISLRILVRLLLHIKMKKWMRLGGFVCLTLILIQFVRLEMNKSPEMKLIRAFSLTNFPIEEVKATQAWSDRGFPICSLLEDGPTLPSIQRHALIPRICEVAQTDEAPPGAMIISTKPEWENQSGSWEKVDQAGDVYFYKQSVTSRSPK